MKNILITVLMLMVVVFMFVTIISGSGGIQDQIEQKGLDAIDTIETITGIPASTP